MKRFKTLKFRFALISIIDELIVVGLKFWLTVLKFFIVVFLPIIIVWWILSLLF